MSFSLCSWAPWDPMSTSRKESLMRRRNEPLRKEILLYQENQTVLNKTSYANSEDWVYSLVTGSLEVNVR